MGNLFIVFFNFASILAVVAGSNNIHTGVAVGVIFVSSLFCAYFLDSYIKNLKGE